MRLVFLHGPAAVGKYTVGRELAALTGFAFFHNHLVVDEVLKQHAFGTPGFVAERDRRWRTYFVGHPGPADPGVIFTFNPESTVPQAFIDWLFSEMTHRQVTLLSVGLTASEAVIEARLVSEARRQFRKLTDLALYRQLRDSGAFTTPVIPHTDLLIDAGETPAPTAARVIARRLGFLFRGDSALS